MEFLIPQAAFVGLPQWALLGIAAAALGVLSRGADWLVDGAVGLSFRFGLPPVIVGATVVSLGTTSPECAVSVMAAWQGDAGLALGNAIGSVVADTGLIFGIGCLLRSLPADRYTLDRQGWIQIGAGVLLAAGCYAAYAWSGPQAALSRGFGFTLLALLGAYLYFSVRWSRGRASSSEHEQPPARSPLALAALIAGGLVLVLLSSQVVIGSVTELAEAHWGVPQIVIAATLVALGTSLPELAIGLTSVLKGRGEILVGNVLGADILNVLFVVGASAAAAPLPIVDAGAEVPQIALLVHLPAMLLILALFRGFSLHAARVGRFRRWAGIPLLAIYAGYTVVQYAVS
ncbi:MAG: sodium:calcium antiporter [Proteobacteria bacterium]|nr:sodium:calcium antiporter [Pseudomonadota bacterium]